MLCLILPWIFYSALCVCVCVCVHVYLQNISLPDIQTVQVRQSAQMHNPLPLSENIKLILNQIFLK